MEITYALMEKTDCGEVAQLLQANAQSQNGGLLGEYPLPKVEAMYSSALSSIVARADHKLIGVVFSFSFTSPSLPPIVQLILREHPSIMINNWLYGPVCIDKNYRGKNILKQLYQQISTHNNGRAVAFINADNLTSIAAHNKLGMHQVSQFIYQETVYWLVQGR